MTKGEITAIRDVATNMADITTPTHKEVQYMIDGKGPYIVYMRMEDYTPQLARQLVEKKVKEWGELVGKAIG